MGHQRTRDFAHFWKQEVHGRCCIIKPAGKTQHRMGVEGDNAGELPGWLAQSFWC